MRVPTLATIMDYIGRAMPWDNPKSLTSDEVYALTAYILHLGGLVESDFVLSDKTFKWRNQTPNRNAFSSDHGLWPGESSATGGMGDGPTTRYHARALHEQLQSQRRALDAEGVLDEW